MQEGACETVIDLGKPGVDVDLFHQLYEEEVKALAEFKQNAVTNGVEDRLLLVFLFSKKLDVAKAVDLLQQNLLIRKELDIPFPVEVVDLNEKLLKSGCFYNIKGARDKNGRGIAYLIPAAAVPSDFTLREYMAIVFWFGDFSRHESPDFHRAGLTLIEDMEHVGFKHFDSRLMSRFKKSSMQNMFPGRIRSVLVVHPPLILRALLQIAKLFVKKKIMQRVSIVKKEELPELVGAAHLHSTYGGSLQYDHQHWVDELLAQHRSRVSSEVIPQATAPISTTATATVGQSYSPPNNHRTSGIDSEQLASAEIFSPSPSTSPMDSPPSS